MGLLSYQHVTGCVAFRAEVKKSVKEGAMFKKKTKKYPGQFSVLISALQPHCLAVTGSYKDLKLRE